MSKCIGILHFTLTRYIDSFTRKFLTCIEVDEDMVWTSIHNSPKIQAWDTEDGSYRRTIDIYSCMQTM